MNKEQLETIIENILFELEKIKDNEAIINDNNYFGLDRELLTYIRFLEQEVKEYKLENKKLKEQLDKKDKAIKEAIDYTKDHIFQFDGDKDFEFLLQILERTDK